jgi:hypothetical protein
MPSSSRRSRTLWGANPIEVPVERRHRGRAGGESHVSVGPHEHERVVVDAIVAPDLSGRVDQVRCSSSTTRRRHTHDLHVPKGARLARRARCSSAKGEERRVRPTKQVENAALAATGIDTPSVRGAVSRNEPLRRRAEVSRDRALAIVRAKLLRRVASPRPLASIERSREPEDAGSDGAALVFVRRGSASVPSKRPPMRRCGVKSWRGSSGARNARRSGARPLDREDGRARGRSQGLSDRPRDLERPVFADELTPSPRLSAALTRAPADVETPASRVLCVATRVSTVVRRV